MALTKTIHFRSAGTNRLDLTPEESRRRLEEARERIRRQDEREAAIREAQKKRRERERAGR